MADLRVGISGWTYPPWRKNFYPSDLAQSRELEYASRQVNSIEINGTFYALQRPTSFRKWYEQTPDDFVFSVKAGRYMTHVRRLYDMESPLSNFFASGILELKEKLGPILWQFPPSMIYDPERFERFFKLLPRDSRSAARMAKKHSPWMRWADTDAHGSNRIRHAVEIRNKSFETREFVSQLRSHDVALVFADTSGKWPYFEDVTSDFIYIRLHGKGELYVGGYDRDSLESWARKIERWSSGSQPSDAHTVLNTKPSRIHRDVFVYFDNDVKVHAPFDAMSLFKRLTEARSSPAKKPRAA